MSPGATKRSFVCKRMKQSKMALSGIVNAGQDSCNDCRPERSIDDEDCLFAPCHDAAFKRRRATFESSHYSCSDRNHPPIVTTRVLNRLGSPLWNLKRLGHWKTVVHFLVADRAESGCVSQPGKLDSSSLQSKKNRPRDRIAGRGHLYRRRLRCIHSLHGPQCEVVFQIRILNRAAVSVDPCPHSGFVSIKA